MKEKKLSLKERVEETKAKFDTTALEVFNNPEHFKNWLRTQLSFHQYSPLNRMLIFAQNPDATYVQSYNKWKEMGHPVIRKGAIRILRPNYVKLICKPESDGTETRIYWNKASAQEKKDAKEGKLKVITKQAGFSTTSVFDISSTDATEEDLVGKTVKKCQDSTNIYQQLSDYLGKTSNAKDDTAKVYEIVKEYVKEELLEKYSDTDIDKYIDIVSESDTYCILNQLNINQTMLAYKTIDSMKWDENKLNDIKIVNKFVCNSSIDFIYDIEQAF